MNSLIVSQWFDYKPLKVRFNVYLGPRLKQLQAITDCVNIYRKDLSSTFRLSPVLMSPIHSVSLKFRVLP